MNRLNDGVTSWIDPKGPVALVLKEHLLPVEGVGGGLFAPVKAAGPPGDSHPT
jgi:hypothetical protein